MNLSQKPKLKTCKQCQNKFEVNHSTGRGGQNSNRTIFCGTKCKNAFNRQKTSGKTFKECEICSKVYLVFLSKVNSSKFCSRACTNKSKVGFDSTKSSFVSCPVCSKQFRKYNRTKYPICCSAKCQQTKTRIVKNCTVCGTEFSVKRSKPNKLRCSRKCQWIDQSNGKIHISTNGRTGYRIDINDCNYYKSALEADFARVMKYIGIDYQYEPATFTTSHGVYTPDFYLPDFGLYVELKGVGNLDSKFAKKMTKNLIHHDELIQRGLNIETITQNEFITLVRYANLWTEIPVLEIRNYRKNRNLIKTYEDIKNNKKTREPKDIN